MPPRRLITTMVLPPRVPAKVACIIASPNIWVTAMRTADRSGRLRGAVRRDTEKSRQPQAWPAVRVCGWSRRSSSGLTSSCGRGCRAGAMARRGNDQAASWWCLSMIVDAVIRAHFSGRATAWFAAFSSRASAALPSQAAQVVDVRVEADLTRPAATTRRCGTSASLGHQPPAWFLVHARSWRRGARPRTRRRPLIGGPSGRGQENSRAAPWIQFAWRWPRTGR